MRALVLLQLLVLSTVAGAQPAVPRMQIRLNNARVRAKAINFAAGSLSAGVFSPLASVDWTTTQAPALKAGAGSDVQLYAGDSTNGDGGTLYLRGGVGVTGGSGDVIVGCQAGAPAGACGVDVCHDATCTAFWLGHGATDATGRLFPWGRWSLPLVFDPAAATNTELSTAPTGPLVVVDSNGPHISGTPLTIKGGLAGDADAGAVGGVGGRLDLLGAAGGAGNGSHGAGNGGDVRLYAGSAGAAGGFGGNANGGTLTLRPGAATGAGTVGAINIGSDGPVPYGVYLGQSGTTVALSGTITGSFPGTHPFKAKDAGYDLVHGDYWVHYTPSGLRAVSLPNPSGHAGECFVISCGAGCTGTTVYLYALPYSTTKIDGTVTAVSGTGARLFNSASGGGTNYQAGTFCTDGTDYFIVARSNWTAPINP